MKKAVKSMKRIKKLSVMLLCCLLLSVIAMPVSASVAKLNKKSISLNVGKIYTLKASGTKEKITWTSSKKSVATVSSKGVVKAKKKGTAVITAKYGKKKLTCKVTVKQPVKSIKLNKTSATLKKGKSLTLKATISPSSANNKAVTWSSSNKKVATVSSKGVVKAVGNGTATITVKAKDGSGKKATCKITVGTSSNTTPTYKTVEITLANWKNYIEKIEVPYYAANAFGEFDRLEIHYYYVVKPEYIPYLDMKKSSVIMEVDITDNCYYATVDFSNKKYTLSEPVFAENFNTSRICTFEDTSVIWSGNDIKGYPKNIWNMKNKIFFGSEYHSVYSTIEQKKTFLPFYPINENMKRITGTLYFKQ